MHHIFIEGLEVDTVIGVYAPERLKPQTLTFDIEVGTRNQRAFTSDDLNDTVDYAAVAELIRAELSSHSFILLERLAHHLCLRIEEVFDATRVRMKIAKADIVPGASAVGVVLERAFPSVESLYGERGSAPAGSPAPTDASD